jgi:hypothetical protein
MTSARTLAISIAWLLSSASVSAAQDLSGYREFQLGTSLVTIARLAGIGPEARVLHQRPALIQELMWLPPPGVGSSPQGDSVRKVLFSFYNDQLFRIAVNYDRDRTQGLTVEDMVEAISTKYGPTTPPATAVVPSLSGVFNDGDRILAHWEDSQYSVNLTSYLSTFALVVSSKRLDALARVASVESMRLDKQEAPQRDVDRQQKQIDEHRVKQETARRVNKAIFRP